MNYQDRISQIQEAQDLLNEAHQLIKDAIHGTGTQQYTKAYLLDHLQIMISSDHGFLSSDENLDKVIERLEEEEEDNEYDENEEE